MPDSVVHKDKNGNLKIDYGYSPLRRFCMSSKKSLSQIMEKGKRFMSKVMQREDMSKDKIEKGDEIEHGE